MPYKNKDKQRKATAAATKRYRERKQGITEPEQTVGITTPEGVVSQVPPNYGKPNCLCLHCIQTKGRLKINHAAYKTRAELGVNEVNRITMEQDVDYKGAVC